jgi:hypothetical protein
MSGNIEEYEYEVGFDCYVVFTGVEANSRREAIETAIRSNEFKPWVKYCRKEGMNPFSGLKVESNPVCKHGVCWCCTECEECVNEV